MQNRTNLGPSGIHIGQFTGAGNHRGATIETALTLHFAPGMRPDVDALLRTAARQAESTAFMVSFLPEPDEGWLEVIAMGLSYDISGLAPLDPAPSLMPDHRYGLDAESAGLPTEAVRIVPGEHISSARMMLPVLRVLAGLGAEFARLPGLRAVGWETSGSWMAPAYYMSAVRAWLSGGAFPALGLTSLRRAANGTMTSEGLSLFVGFELELAPIAGEPPQETAKLAARLIHQLVHSGSPSQTALVDLQGQPLSSTFDAKEGILRAWRNG